MIKRIHIQGFQSHTDSIIEFDSNVTAIIGLNNHGKSAVLKALRKAVRNLPEGKSFITLTPEEKNVSSITVETDVGSITQRVGRKASSTDNMYIVETDQGKLEFTKFGKTGIPEEVVNTFNISPPQKFGNIEFDLNFQVQRDNLFLVTGDGLSSVRSKVVSRVTGVDKVQRAIQIGRLRESNLNKEHTALQSKKQAYLIELEEYAALDSLVGQVDLLESQVIELDDCEKSLNFYKTKVSSLQNLITQARQLQSTLSVVQNVPEIRTVQEKVAVIAKLKSLHSLQSRILLLEKQVNFVTPSVESCSENQRILSLLQRLNKIQTDQSILASKVTICVPTITQAQETSQVIEQLRSDLQKITTILTSAQNTLNSISSFEEKMKTAEEELYNYKKEIGVCPTCQQRFKL